MQIKHFKTTEIAVLDTYQPCLSEKVTSVCTVRRMLSDDKSKDEFGTNSREIRNVIVQYGSSYCHHYVFYSCYCYYYVLFLNVFKH